MDTNKKFIAKEKPYIVTFKESSKELHPLVGGKGANLGELTRAGFNVPNGFIITTNAYYESIKDTGIEELIDQLSDLAIDLPDDIKRICKNIRGRLNKIKFPQKLRENILKEYISLAHDEYPVAVRSSATAEDLEDASFAGQQDTFLNIIGKDALMEAIKNCWMSLWNDRAVIYRMKNNINHNDVGISVVIQKLILSKVAGVLFTANPLTGKRTESVIEANPGLGESVVSGVTNPDSFTVNNLTGTIINQNISNERLVTEAMPEGGIGGLKIKNSKGTPCLNDTQIKLLVETGNEIMAHYRRPQDIEWALDKNDNIWILQSRPITTLYPLPDNAPSKEDSIRVYVSATVDEGMIRPITPMGIEAYRIIVSAVAKRLWNIELDKKEQEFPPVVEAGLRFFYDITPIVKSVQGRKLLDRFVPEIDNYSAAIWNRLADDDRLNPEKTPIWNIVKIVFTPLMKTNFIVTTLRAFINPNKTRIRINAGFEKILNENIDLTSPCETLLAHVQGLIRNWAFQLPVLGFSEAVAGYAAFEMAKLFLKGLAGEDELQSVLKGIPNNPTTEMGLAIWDAAKQIKSDKDSMDTITSLGQDDLLIRYNMKILPKALQKSLDEFLSFYGDRAVSEIDLGLPRWREDPRHIINVIVNYVRLEDSSKSPDFIFANSIKEGEGVLQALIQRAGKKSKLRAHIVRFLLNRARSLIGRREVWKTQMTSIYSKVREILLIIGEHLSDNGLLYKKDDIFFLTIDSILRGINGECLKPLVEGITLYYENEMTRTSIPMVLLSDGTVPSPKFTAVNNSADVLKGVPASPGIITGRARIILNPTDAVIKPGEILIAPSADPGWTPLFLTAGGLIMERGGAISHGSVVAREYGIPAVVGVLGVLSKIKTGQMVTVNGFDGTVNIED